MVVCLLRLLGITTVVAAVNKGEAMSDCKHDNVSVAELNKDGYNDETLLGCRCCMRDENERLTALLQRIAEIDYTRAVASNKTVTDTLLRMGYTEPEHSAYHDALAKLSSADLRIAVESWQNRSLLEQCSEQADEIERLTKELRFKDALIKSDRDHREVAGILLEERDQRIAELEARFAGLDEDFRDNYHYGYEAGIKMAVDSIPTSWLDPSLSGKDSIPLPMGTKEVEELLRRIKARIQSVAKLQVKS
jgi:hypothetical protein